MPICVLPHPPVYHTQLGAEFKAPPTTCSVVDWPAVIVVWVAVAFVGEVGAVQHEPVVAICSLVTAGELPHELTA